MRPQKLREVVKEEEEEEKKRRRRNRKSVRGNDAAKTQYFFFFFFFKDVFLRQKVGGRVQVTESPRRGRCFETIRRRTKETPGSSLRFFVFFDNGAERLARQRRSHTFVQLGDGYVWYLRANRSRRHRCLENLDGGVEPSQRKVAWFRHGWDSETDSKRRCL